MAELALKAAPDATTSLDPICGTGAVTRTQRFAGGLVVSLVAAVGALGHAAVQAFPLRPVTIVVPFAAGGAVDTIARILADRMRVPLGQPVIIDNVGGGGGSIGTGRVVRAAPDGYTLCLGSWATHVVYGAVYPLKYDLLNDLEPVALVESHALVIVARKTFPADDLSGFIAWLRANPDKASLGSSGIGSGPHVVGAFLQRMTGTRFQFVPYRGLGPAMQDLVSGQIDFLIDGAANALPQVRAGSVKAYAVTAKHRLAAAPEIPTVDEAGVPGFYASSWYALWAPKGTPKDVIGTLNAAVSLAFADPATSRQLAHLGLELPPREQWTPEALGAYHKAEIEKWWPIIKAANLAAQ